MGKNLTVKVKELYRTIFRRIKIIETSSSTAELIKYMNNSFLATKYRMNEFKLLSNKIGCNWNDALKVFLRFESEIATCKCQVMMEN